MKPTSGFLRAAAALVVAAASPAAAQAQNRTELTVSIDLSKADFGNVPPNDLNRWKEEQTKLLAEKFKDGLEFWGFTDKKGSAELVVALKTPAVNRAGAVEYSIRVRGVWGVPEANGLLVAAGSVRPEGFTEGTTGLPPDRKLASAVGAAADAAKVSLPEKFKKDVPIANNVFVDAGNAHLVGLPLLRADIGDTLHLGTRYRIQCETKPVKKYHALVCEPIPLPDPPAGRAAGCLHALTAEPLDLTKFDVKAVFLTSATPLTPAR